MQARFGIERERHNRLYYKSYQNDKGTFHFHSQIELYFVDSGEMEVTVGDQQRVLSGGEMSVALSYDPHAYRTPTASTSSVLIIPPYVCEEFVAAMRCKRVSHPFITDKDAVRRIREHYTAITGGGCNEIEQLGHIYVILGIVMDHIGPQEAAPSMETELSSRILFYLNEHYREELSLSALATAFGYSPSYLSRYFKDRFHIGLKQYVTVLRLKNAVLLMHEQRHSITYCALESGFTSMRTFYRAFREEFGCAPQEYRNIALDKPFGDMI